jgi:hypothetical protein
VLVSCLSRTSGRNMSKYRAEYTTQALLQLELLSQFEDMWTPLAELSARARGWVHYGPIALDANYEDGSLVDHGRYHCGRAHELTRGRMIAVISIRDDGTLFLICDIQRS